MTLLLLLLAVTATQIHVVADAWLGPAAPDPTVCLAAFCGLYWPRGTLPLAALALGWGRAMVLVEPAGGQVLCALVALALVATQRDDNSTSEGGYALVWAALTVSLAWAAAGWLLGQFTDVPIKAGRELFLGSVLALPFVRLAPVTARVAGFVTT